MKTMSTLPLFMAIFLYVGSFRTVLGQTNLVTNGDLETRNAIPQLNYNVGPGNPDDLPNWDAIFYQIPSYFADDGIGVASLSSLGVSAHSGLGCVGVQQHDQNADHDFDALMTQQLLQPLIPGHRYRVQFWALRGDNFPYHAKVSLSITNGPPTFDSKQNTLLPSPGSKTVVSPETFGASGWFLVSGIIDIPQGETNNKWITIGADRFNQYYDPSIPNVNFGSLYHLIDDISIVDLMITGSSNVCGASNVTFSANPNVSVIWNASPSSLFTTTSGYGSTFTTGAVANAAGQGTISATFLNEPGAPVVTKTVTVIGSLVQPGIIAGNSSICYARTGDGRDRTRLTIATPAPNGTYYHGELVDAITGEVFEPEIDGIIGGPFDFLVIGGNYGLGLKLTLRVRIQTATCFGSWGIKTVDIVQCNTGGCTGRNCPPLAREANSYPNPANEVLTIPSTEQNAVATFYNVFGVLCKQTQIHGRSAATFVNVADLVVGVYRLCIVNEDKSTINTQITIQR